MVSNAAPAPYLANLIEEEGYALEGLAEILTQTFRPEHAAVLEDCAAKIAAVARAVRCPRRRDAPAKVR